MKFNGWSFQQVAIAMALLLTVSANTFAADQQAPSPAFSQFLMTDESRQKSIEEVQISEFTLADELQKQKFSKGAVWLRLQADDKTVSSEIFYLKILPALLTEITVYRPASLDAGGGWESKTYTGSDLNAPIPIGSVEPQSSTYLKLISPIDFRLFTAIDVKEKINLLQRRIDVFVVMIFTVFAMVALMTVIRLFFQFNALSLGLLLISISLPIAFICTTGLLPFLMGLDQSLSPIIFPKSMLLTIFFFMAIWVLIASRLFKNGRFIKYLWGWVVLLGILFVASFFDATLSMNLLEETRKYGKWACFVLLMIQGFQSRHLLQLTSEKIAFVTLLLFLLIPLPVSSLFFKPFVNSLTAVEAPFFLESIFFKALMPVALFILLAWTDNRLKHDRISSLTGQLKIASDNLEQESARLDQQKKFTAMLTHELKNPLMASQMALSSIQTRLGVDDPSLPRVNSISHSLQEIDAIIERCAEIDKYEQGYFPLALGRHTLGELISLIKASHPSERVYTIVRSANDDFEFRTDLYYIRIVLNNLLSNALKYSVADSLVEFKVEHLQAEGTNELVFSVSNDIAPECAPDPGLVFKRYYRSETAKQQSGAGLGLWLAQSMAHALGSDIQLKMEDRVVKFHFSIPV